MNIITKQIFIERSVHFEEPLQQVELVKEETTEIPSCSADHSDDENESERSDISYLMSDISEHNISVSESYPNFPTHLTKWAKETLPSIGTNIGNPVDPRRTRSYFQREGISIYFHDSSISGTCYMIIGFDPKSYYHAHKDPRWKAAMDEEFNSLRKKNATWELVSLPPRRKLVQCKWVYQTKVDADGSTCK